MRIFIDTGAFIALTDKDDDNHEAAGAFYRTAKEKGARFVTTNFVVCETMNYLRAKVSHAVPIAFREGIKKSTHIEIVAVTPSAEDEAFAIFKQYKDKDFSFTDCTSFAVMRHFKLHKAFAFDRHFEQYKDLQRLP